MTFEDFQIFCIDQQKAYITSERERFTKAQEIATEYGHAVYEVQKHVFDDLGLWPHTLTEIAARFAELDDMEARMSEDFGDTPAMRFSYDYWLKRQS